MKAETKFTPGPWEVGVYRNGVPGIVYCNNALGSAVAVVYGEKLPYSVFSREEEEANAHLIASAPLLFEALHRLEVTANSAAYCYSNRPENFAAALRDLRDDAESARAALAAARGTKE